MSHFTKVAHAVIKDKAAFIKAAKELGFSVVKGEMRGYNGATKAAELVVRKPGCMYDIGLQKGEDGTFEMEADWYGLHGVQEELSQLTTKHTITSKYAAQGFMVNEVKQDDGSIKIRMSR